MIPLPARWAELATTDFADGALAGAVALLPVAAIEQHGPHLPLGTDAIIAEGIAERAFGLLPAATKAILLPVLPIGTSNEHAAFPGTLTLDAATLIRTWTAVGEGVHRAGISKLLIFNAHGGQAGLIEAVAVDLRARLGMVVAWASPGGFGLPDGAIDPQEVAHGLHGGQKETAMMLHLRADLVRREAQMRFASAGEAMAARFRWLRPTGRTGYGWLAGDLNQVGVVGDAAAATAELGARLVAHAAEGLAAMIGELLAFEPPHPGSLPAGERES